MVNDVHHIDVMKIQFSLFNLEFILRKFKSLINQINVLILHFPYPVKSVYTKINNPSESDFINPRKYIIYLIKYMIYDDFFFAKILRYDKIKIFLCR